jgi:hypothetical protein
MRHVFLDEAGDLGWTFDRPYRHGGSSRYLTLAMLVADQDLCKHPKRLVKRFCGSHDISPSRELKGSNLSQSASVDFARQASEMLVRWPLISLLSITVNKQRVQPHIRTDPNKLYNYMVNLCLPDLVVSAPQVAFSPDPRSVKVASGQSMVDYLQTQLWFQYNAATILHHMPVESHQSLAIQFVDVVAHIVWSFHEDAQRDAYGLLSPRMICKQLFFG